MSRYMTPRGPRFASFDLSAAAETVAKRQSTALTFAELVAAYDAAHPNKEPVDRRLRKWVRAFGTLSAWDIPRDDLARAAQGMVEAGYKPSSANRDLGAIGSVYKWAIYERKCSPAGFTSPTRDIPRFEESMRRVEATPELVIGMRALSKAHKSLQFALFVHLLTDTGARRGEVLAAKWLDLDSQRAELKIDGKTGQRVLPLTPETLEIARRLRPIAKDRQGERIFMSRRGGTFEVRKPWHEMMTTLGRPDLTRHDVRHVVAARMLRAKVGIAVAAQALGHSSLILQRRYGHLDTASTHEAQRAGWRDAGLLTNTLPVTQAVRAAREAQLAGGDLVAEACSQAMEQSDVVARDDVVTRAQIQLLMEALESAPA